MSRRFLRSTSTSIKQTVGGGGFVGMTWGSMVAVVNRTLAGSTYYAPFGQGNVGNSDDAWTFFFNPSNQFDFYWVGSDNLGTPTNPTFDTTTGWYLAGATKATGSAIPRLHSYKFSTNAWVHENVGVARADASSFDTNLWFGSDALAQNWDGDIAALMLLPQRVLSDGEFERLPRGLWEQVATGPRDILREFAPSERIVSGVATERNIDRFRHKDATTAGTSRSPIRDPPGFRFSAINRRQ